MEFSVGKSERSIAKVEASTTESSSHGVEIGSEKGEGSSRHE